MGKQQNDYIKTNNINVYEHFDKLNSSTMYKAGKGLAEGIIDDNQYNDVHDRYGYAFGCYTGSDFPEWIFLTGSLRDVREHEKKFLNLAKEMKVEDALNKYEMYKHNIETNKYEPIAKKAKLL